MLRDLSSLGNAEATIKTLQLELEKLQWRHNQELAEMKHNTGKFNCNNIIYHIIGWELTVEIYNVIFSL